MSYSVNPNEVERYFTEGGEVLLSLPRAAGRRKRERRHRPLHTSGPISGLALPRRRRRRHNSAARSLTSGRTFARGNELAAHVSNGSKDNQVTENDFIDNRQQVRFLDAKSITWNGESRGNYWSHYVGWDRDRNGIGDTQFLATRLSDRLTYAFPVLRVILESPSMRLLQRIENQFPVDPGGRHHRPISADAPRDPMNRLQLEVEGVRFAYRAGEPVLRGASCVFPAGELTALLGNNGSGKTTLLKILVGIHSPDAGSVRFEGEPVSDRKTARDTSSRSASCPSRCFSILKCERMPRSRSWRG